MQNYFASDVAYEHVYFSTIIGYWRDFQTCNQPYSMHLLSEGIRFGRNSLHWLLGCWLCVKITYPWPKSLNIWHTRLFSLHYISNIWIGIHFRVPTIIYKGFYLKVGTFLSKFLIIYNHQIVEKLCQLPINSQIT